MLTVHHFGVWHDNLTIQKTKQLRISLAITLNTFKPYEVATTGPKSQKSLKKPKNWPKRPKFDL